MRGSHPDAQRPRLVHRLDKDTAGCLLVAKTRFAASALAKTFRTRSARKIYWALVAGVPKPQQGRISTFLAKQEVEEDSYMRIAKHGEKDAVHAVTYYAVVETAAQKLAWISLKPVTGRTHQLRAHMAHVGNPIVGDPKYFNIENWELPGGIQNKLHLLARRIVVPHPRGGIIDVSAPLPPHMEQSWNLLGFDAKRYDPIVDAVAPTSRKSPPAWGLDERIGRRFLEVGIGFGGSCFPEDLSAFIKIAEQIGYDFRLLKEVQHINGDQMERFVKKIINTLWVLKDKKIGVLGLAFKQNTDDVRMSPAIELCDRLQKEGASLARARPKGDGQSQGHARGNVTYVDDMNAVAEGCDALVVATEWDEFKKLDLERARKSLTHPIMFDGRNLFDRAEMERLGWIYKSVGTVILHLKVDDLYCRTAAESDLRS